MDADTRKRIMDNLKRAAKDADFYHDATARNMNADSWRNLATEAEAKRAPKCLTWTGRVNS